MVGINYIAAVCFANFDVSLIWCLIYKFHFLSEIFFRFGSLLACESFHADVHAGNLWLLRDGRIGFLDFGKCTFFKLISCLVSYRLTAVESFFISRTFMVGDSFSKLYVALMSSSVSLF